MTELHLEHLPQLLAPAPGMNLFARRQAEADHLAQQVASILRENPDINIKRTAGATPAGDETKLRGIPAIGRGVQGAIRGTRP